ncbi:anti-anti-sigma factor [Micromonospora pattaloongensis]|uniref:Anti-anti-sigma factor n=1 Tax=Micromonospora pattaloongensis TaxID=405436 RepID=A0A1H3QQM5_9ACTN|nr:STAS domain-containing protein [Micromonospora pattaloongensis]SDZ15630.1 anti-anti-sigma factor [Micromonospora pattaloongensis]
MHLVINASEVGPTLRLTLAGGIGLATADRLRDAVAAALASSAPKQIALDFARVSFIDSAGISTLVACHRSAAVAGTVLRLENVSPVMRRRLWATGLPFGASAAPPGQPQP